MKIAPSVRRFAPAVAAFVLVCTGSLLLIPRDRTSGAPSEVTVLVATRAMPAGTASEDVKAGLATRSVPTDAAVQGALSSPGQVPVGVLAVPLVPGQQVTAASFASTRVAALGDGYVALSVRLDSQRWTGPARVTGDRVDVYGVRTNGTELITPGATVLDSPPVDGLAPRDEAVITLGLPRGAVGAVLAAASEERLWLVGT